MNNSSSSQKKMSLIKGKSEFMELVRFTIITLLIVIPIRMFIAQPFIVNGESMLPTFHNGDYLIIDEVSYRTSEPERGEVIVFKFENKRFLIKRVIGLPGEEINITGDRITITSTEGEKIELREEYIKEQFSSYGTWNLGENEYFVLGDNRNASSDSRTWGILDGDDIVGKTFLRLFPFSGIGLNPGEIDIPTTEDIN